MYARALHLSANEWRQGLTDAADFGATGSSRSVA